MNTCQTPNRPYMFAEGPQGKVLIFQPRCKMWSCAACSTLNLYALRYQMEQAANQLINEGETLYFLTITSHKDLDAPMTWQAWPDCWKKLGERVRYHTGRKFHYFMIPEVHKNGRLHMHAIETFGLGTRFFKDHGAACGLGYINEEEELRGTGGAIHYVTKYISKTVGDTGPHWPKRARRYRKSRSWPKPPPPDKTEWTFNPVTKKERIDDIAQKSKMAGRTVIFCDHLTAWEHVTGEKIEDKIE